jgi:hypothetical protein
MDVTRVRYCAPCSRMDIRSFSSQGGSSSDGDSSNPLYVSMTAETGGLQQPALCKYGSSDGDSSNPLYVSVAAVTGIPATRSM